MSNIPSMSELQGRVGLLGGLVRQGRLGWRLLRDGRVPGWVKLIPFAALIYFFSPIDLVPDLVLPGLGEVDDIVVLLLALKAFVELSPPGVVREHLESLFGHKGTAYSTDDAGAGPVIDAPYQIIEPAAE